MMVDGDRSEGIYSVVIDIPEDERAWKRILKDPSKFLAKSVQKGVEVAWAKLNDQQKAAMQEAKKAELESWVARKVVQAAAPDITEDQALRMRWIYTFKAAGEQHPGKLKAKARIVILGFSDPSLLEQDTASPSLTRLSKMLLLNMATARRWRVLSGDVKTAFLQAKSPDRAHPLHARPLPELAEAMGLPPDRMVELLGSAYGLTSAPREWFVDLTGTIKRLRGQRCHTDPCLWRIFNEANEIVGIIGIFVDDLLFAGDEESGEWITFLQELHSHYEWSPWETDSFTHCGIKITQDNDEAIHLDHSGFRCKGAERVKLMSVSQHFVEQSTMLQWCDSDHQAADGMTKSQKQDAVRKLVSSGRWPFRLDGAFISAKKRKAMNRREM